MKQQGVSLLRPGWDASPSQGYPSIMSLGFAPCKGIQKGLGIPTNLDSGFCTVGSGLQRLDSGFHGSAEIRIPESEICRIRIPDSLTWSDLGTY